MKTAFVQAAGALPCGLARSKRKNGHREEKPFRREKRGDYPFKRSTMKEELNGLVENCTSCAEARAKLHELLEAIKVNNMTRLHAQLLSHGSGSKEEALIGWTIKLKCAACNDKRMILTAKGRTLAELALAEVRAPVPASPAEEVEDPTDALDLAEVPGF